MHRRSIAALTAALSLLLSSGCALGFRSPDAVKDHVSQRTGTPYTRQGGIEIGRSAITLARIAVSASGAEMPESLAGIKGLQAGVYRPDADVEDSGASARLTAEDFRAYDVVLGFQSGAGDDVLLLSRGSGDRIRELLLVVDAPQQLSIVQVRGKLEDVLEHAVRLAFDRMERPELSDEALRGLADGGA